MEIEYKGQRIKTKHWYELSDEKYKELVNEFYAKPDIGSVEKEMKKIHLGGVKISNITDYYVKDLMYKTKLTDRKWTIEEVLEYKPLLQVMYSKTMDNKKVFPETASDLANLKTAFRLCGKGIATKPSNFPLKTVNYVLDKYNINNNYYDFSCGWGSRLLGALKHNMNYYGTDPNYLLTERLCNMSDKYKEVNNVNPVIDIRSVGSEIYQSDWENKMGLAFSSPPYYCLEDYGIGDQSYKPGG